MPDPGWVQDPSGRYHQRYFDGQRWTEHVADEYGRRGIDPVETIGRGGPPTGAGAYSPAAPAGGGSGFAPSARSLVGLAGAVVSVVAITLLPWLEDLRIAQLGSPFAGGFGVWKSSYFESGWIVTLIAVFLAGAASVAATSRAPWMAAIPVGVCTLWAAGGTTALKRDLSGLSFGYGFFVALVGLVAATVAPVLPGPAATPSTRR